MAHKYLEDIGVMKNDDLNWVFNSWNPEDKRYEKWLEQQKVFGFDDRETWSLDTVFYMWLYERLMMFRECADGRINLDYHQFHYKGTEYTQRQLVDLMIDRIRFRFSDEFDEYNEKHTEVVRSIAEVWAIVLPVMWW